MFVRAGNPIYRDYSVVTRSLPELYIRQEHLRECIVQCIIQSSGIISSPRAETAYPARFRFARI